VKASKSALRWRTALVLRELESELEALEASHEAERSLAERMAEKTRRERDLDAVRLRLQRMRKGYGPADPESEAALGARLGRLRAELETLDETIAPLARAAGERGNPLWGLLLRAGNDKSHLARQLERSADVYLSRVSRFLGATPFAYFRAPRGSMPHDPRVE
jgi:DNA repair exonuclease SbcCD ATPase subunit